MCACTRCPVPLPLPLGDYNENVRNVGVAKMLARRKQVAEESASNDECPHALSSSLIRLFDLPSYADDLFFTAT